MEPIADWWLDEIKRFLTKPHKAYIVLGNNRKYFKSYKEKLDYLCLSVVFENYRIKKQKRICIALLNHWWQHLDSIILAKPEAMTAQVHIWMNKKIGQVKLLEALSPVFVMYYDLISDALGKDLVGKINIKTCPYCNRQFLYTFKGRSLERPELDHFFPKSKFPLYCLSFYNLIPACHSCNHVKLEDLIGVNPYQRAFNRRFVITDENGNKLSKSKIYRLTEREIRLAFDGHNSDEEKNDSVLGLEDVYNKHGDYVKELIDKSMAYDKYAREVLVNSFQGAGFHPRQVFDFVWGRHLIDALYEDRPLSKLTKDILELLDIRRM